MSKYYYCAMCDVQLKDVELEGFNCPYCQTEIPEAVEDDPMRAANDDIMKEGLF